MADKARGQAIEVIAVGVGLDKVWNKQENRWCGANECVAQAAKARAEVKSLADDKDKFFEIKGYEKKADWTKLKDKINCNLCKTTTTTTTTTPEPTPLPTPEPTPKPTPAPPTYIKKCETATELIFLVDSSGSVGQENVKNTGTFLK